MKPNPAKPKPERKREERQDWAIVLVILLLGLCCVAGAGQYALRLAPDWQLDADMGSNLDLNSEFLTSKPIAYFEPIDPAILTLPAWVSGNVFLTPGAGDSFVHNRTPLPTSDQDTPVPTVPGTIPVGTTTLAVTTSPTNTLVWIPVRPTRTSRPNPGATNTSPPSAPRADLWITKDSTTNTYTAGSTLTYRVRVGNNGPDNLSNVTVWDNKPDQIASWTWTCTNPGVNDCNGASLNSANFTDIVNLPSGASIEYTIDVTTNSFGGNLTNTALVNRAGYTETNPGDEQDGHTHTLVVALPQADLQITVDDGAANYTPGASRTYTIQVYNNGPDAITGATVTDTFLSPITGAAGGSCTTTNGATCGWSGTGNINDTVNLPANSTITYTVPVTTNLLALMPLENTATIWAAGYDESAPGDETDTDTDTFVVDPPGSIGSSSDCAVTWPCTTELSAGSSLILNRSVTVSGSPGPDIIYYERPNGANIRMDWVILQIGDGTNTYTILDWGNQGGGGADTNTNINVADPTFGPPEDDDRVISQSTLYPQPGGGTGVSIELDGFVPPGTYTYIHIIVPWNDPTGNGCGIDAIEVLSP